METLIELMGGTDTFESRLDLMVRDPKARLTGAYTMSSLNRTCLFKIWVPMVPVSQHLSTLGMLRL